MVASQNSHLPQPAGPACQGFEDAGADWHSSKPLRCLLQVREAPPGIVAEEGLSWNHKVLLVQCFWKASQRKALARPKVRRAEPEVQRDLRSLNQLGSSDQN